MTLAAVVSPYQPINGLTGLGLNDGAMYIGLDGQDPETDPQPCFWDAAGATPAAQPIQILGGYPMRLGTPTRLYTAPTYSIRVRDAQGVQVFYEAHAVPGGGTNAGFYDTRAAAIAAIIPPTLNYIVIAGRWLFSRQGGAGTYPGSFLQSADGAYWLYQPDVEGVDAAAFGMVNDGVAGVNRVFSGTDNHTFIQQAIDYATYGLKCPVLLPAGIYLIADALQAGYGATLKTTVLIGAGKQTRGENAFTGTMLLCAFNDRPGIAINGQRNFHCTGVSFMGTNFHWIESENLAGPTPGVDDTVLANWIDPAFRATANLQYTPYCAVAVDPYAGAQPGTHYPNVTFPAWSGIVTQYGKTPSSSVVFEDCYFGGFVGLCAIQPADIDANGDFVKFVRCSGEFMAWIISAGNNQGRMLDLDNCQFTAFHTGLQNTVHGQQQGQFDLTATNTQWEGCVQILNLPGASFGGACTFIGGYSESLWKIGTWGQNAASERTLTFIGYNFHFTLQDDARGYPAKTLDAPANSPVTFESCTFDNFNNVFQLSGGTPLNFRVVNCQVNSNPVANPYQESAISFLAGGIMFPPNGADARPETFSVKGLPIYDLDSHAENAVYVKGYSTTKRQNPICAWPRMAQPANQPSYQVQTPALWDSIDKGSLASLTLVGSTLTVTFAARTDQVFMYSGPLPGDVIWDDQTGTVFFVRSRIGLVVLAELQNNYNKVAGVVTPLAAISMSVGNIYFGNSRVFLPQYYLRGDISSASPIITNAARDDGFATWMTTATQIVVNDYMFVSEQIDGFFGSAATKITAVDGVAQTITLNGNGAVTETRHPLGFFVRQPPANV